MPRRLFQQSAPTSAPAAFRQSFRPVSPSVRSRPSARTSRSVPREQVPTRTRPPPRARRLRTRPSNPSLCPRWTTRVWRRALGGTSRSSPAPAAPGRAQARAKRLARARPVLAGSRHARSRGLDERRKTRAPARRPLVRLHGRDEPSQSTWGVGGVGWSASGGGATRRGDRVQPWPSPTNSPFQGLHVSVGSARRAQSDVLELRAARLRSQPQAQLAADGPVPTTRRIPSREAAPDADVSPSLPTQASSEATRSGPIGRVGTRMTAHRGRVRLLSNLINNKTTN
jgi:hypothetical protein